MLQTNEELRMRRILHFARQLPALQAQHRPFVPDFVPFMGQNNRLDPIQQEPEHTFLGQPFSSAHVDSAAVEAAFIRWNAAAVEAALEAQDNAPLTALMHVGEVPPSQATSIVDSSEEKTEDAEGSQVAEDLVESEGIQVGEGGPNDTGSAHVDRLRNFMLRAGSATAEMIDEDGDGEDAVRDPMVTGLYDTLLPDDIDARNQLGNKIHATIDAIVHVAQCCQNLEIKLALNEFTGGYASQARGLISEDMTMARVLREQLDDAVNSNAPYVIVEALYEVANGQFQEGKMKYDEFRRRVGKLLSDDLPASFDPCTADIEKFEHALFISKRLSGKASHKVMVGNANATPCITPAAKKKARRGGSKSSSSTIQSELLPK